MQNHIKRICCFDRSKLALNPEIFQLKHIAPPIETSFWTQCVRPFREGEEPRSGNETRIQQEGIIFMRS